MAKKNIDPQNILVRMPNWIGDMVMATPILFELRKKFPKSSITAMCHYPICSLLKKDPNIDEILPFDKTSFFNKEKRKDIVRKIKIKNYDLGVLLTNSFSSAWFFFSGGIKYRVGFTKPSRFFFLNMPVKFPENKKQQHLVITYKKMLVPLGIENSFSSPKLYIDETELTETKKILKDYGYEEEKGIIGINPGAAYGAAKCWIPNRFREITLKLLEKTNKYIIFFGDSSHQELIKSICKDLSKRVINLCGVTTVSQLTHLISLCDIFLTNDSGPMHIASALKIPLVALFGSTSKVVTGPYNGGVVIDKNVCCSPCLKRKCPTDFICMKKIEVEEVFEILKKEIKKSDFEKNY
jgi:heptosyltransferase-2